MKRRIAGFLFVFLFFGLPLLAQGQSGACGLTGRMATFVFQLGIILFAARLGCVLMEKIKLPGLLGEILAGVLIGPYLLGGLSLPGFPSGLFPLYAGIPVSELLYAFTTVSSIILLFLVGLETDIDTFLSFSVTGSLVGLGGLVASFFFGAGTVVILSPYFFGQQYGFMHPMSLFLGVIATATSVSISARILSERRKMDSPEGVTILSAAVIDDVLGIIVLAIVIGVIKSGHVSWGYISLVSLKAVSIWLGFTAVGLIFSRRLSALLKRARDNSTIAVMSLACALLLAGVFERSGLAMIVGAYIMGLSLSKTDLSFAIQEHLSSLYKFFIPVFFCVMGMMVNLKSIISPNILFFGLAYIIAAVSAKVLGCGIPSFFQGFNFRGALRVGLGMVPRGEVALIIAGMGLSSGIIGHDTFSVAIALSFVTSLMTPPLLARTLKSKLPVLRKRKPIRTEHKLIVYPTPNPETAELILVKVIAAFEEENFFVHRINLEQTLYQIRKDRIFITLNYTPKRLVFDCLEKDAFFVHMVFYEVIAELEGLIRHLETFTDKEKIGKKMYTEPNGTEQKRPCLSCMLNPEAVEISLMQENKQGIIEELVRLLVRSGQLPQDKIKSALEDLMERESSVSTGMQDGVALPHAKTAAVEHLVWAIGIKKEGINFASLDNKPANIFVIILSPKEAGEPHLQFMAEISRFLMSRENREKLLSSRDNEELYQYIFSHKLR